MVEMTIGKLEGLLHRYASDMNVAYVITTPEDIAYCVEAQGFGRALTEQEMQAAMAYVHVNGGGDLSMDNVMNLVKDWLLKLEKRDE